jgi:serine phosphatase RsbU (regulator of sigma subunit)
MKKALLFLLLIPGLLPVTLVAQDKARLRSAMKNLETATDDTNKVNWLNDVAWDTSYDDLAVGRRYVTQSLELAKKLSFQPGLVRGYNTLGAIALDMGDMNGALEAHFSSLKIADSLKMQRSMATSYMNIANVYSVQRNDSLRLVYLSKSIAINRSLNNYNGLAVSLANMGNLQFELDSVDKAAEYLNEALAIAEKLNIPLRIGASLSGLARCEARKGNTAKAIDLIQRALYTVDTTGSTYEIALIHIDYGQVYTDLKRYDSAEAHYNKALTLYSRLKMPAKFQDIYEGLARMNEQKGDWKQALLYTRKATLLKDSMQSERVLQHQRDMESMYKLAEKEQAIEMLNQQKSSQKIFLWLAIAGCVLLLLFLAVLFNRNKLRQKSNELLEEKKTQLELQNATIEEKNKSITDSINYAHRIQSALWPRAQDFEQYLHSGFVMLKPKDIVSGDFYWLAERDGYIFIATVDCTGHGVPGGFMSMLGSLLLTEIISDKGIIEPAEVLNQLRRRVITALRQTGESNDSKDGMDMVLYRFKKENRELTYAAANNSFYVITKGELKEYQPDKQPVGYHLEMKPFTQHSLTLSPDSLVYTYTDGIADQFGGPAGKKFKYKQFREVLIKYSSLAMHLQEVELMKELEKWQGNHEQVDDILVMGIRFW